VQLNPGFSILYGWLSAPLTKLGRLDEAKVAGAQLLALDPGFGYLRRNADRSKSAGDGEPTPCGLPASA
jgi:hypothetical protein